MAKVICGANQQEVAEGVKVGEIRANYKEILNIADDAEVILNGDKVGDDYVLKQGDSLEFIKKAGNKG